LSKARTRVNFHAPRTVLFKWVGLAASVGYWMI
jgi:hypothetical protein